jgi:glycosyltransferase involved in cell wall biosynthesis
MHIGIVGLFPRDENDVFTGPMRVVHQLSMALSRLRGNEVTVIRACRLRNIRQSVVESQKDNLTVTDVPYPKLSRYLHKRDDFDILNIHGVSLFNWLSMKSHRSKRAVFTAHGYIPLERKFGFRHSMLKAGIEKNMARRSQAMTTISQETRVLLTEGFSIPPEKIHVIGNGVDTRFFSPGRKTSGAHQKKDIVEIVFVGSMLPIKGLDFLLRAFERIGNLPYVLRLVGAPTDHLEELKKKFGRLFSEGKVVFDGQKNQASLLKSYSESDFFVLTSQYDQYPQVVLEACAMQLPVVISDRVGVKAVLRDGEEGFIVPYGDAACLADRLKTLILHPAMRKNMGKKARLRAEKNSWPMIAELYMNYFIRILG